MRLRWWNRFVLVVGVAGVLGNLIFFVRLFPGVERVPPALAEGIAEHLPVQRDVYRPPVPSFLSDASAHHVYVSMESPVSIPLVRYHADEATPLASLTKLMTAYLALRYDPMWEKVVTIEVSDRRPGAQQRLYPGEAIRMDDLWRLLLVGSDNDATTAFLRGLGVEEETFVAAMNAEAVRLRLIQTRFVEPTGLSAGNVSTAREFAVVARLALAEPRIAETLRLPEVTVLVDGSPRTIRSTDQLLKERASNTSVWRFDAGKTGYTEEAGYTVALAAEGTQAGERLLIVLFGSTSLEARAAEAEAFIEWALGVAALAPFADGTIRDLLY